MEGEGTFLAGPPSAPHTPSIRLEVTDRDVVVRVAGIFGRALLSLAPRDPRFKPSFATTIKGSAAVKFMRTLRPLLSVTRQQQIDRALASREGARRRRTPTLTRAASTDARPCNDECDVQWLAGLLEGEGTFSIQRQRSSAYPVIAVHMTEATVVMRAAGLLGAAAVRREAPREAHWKESFAASIAGHAAAEWMRRLRPLMSERRRAAIDAALAVYDPIRLLDPPGMCVVPDFGRPHRSRGLCHKHYMWMRDRADGREPRVTALR